MSTLTCNHCYVTFPDNQEGVPLLGLSDEQKKLFQYIHIDKHLEIMHPEVYQAAALLVGKLKWLTVMAHVSEGGMQISDLWKKRRLIAAEISHATGREVTDEDLERALANVTPFLIYPHSDLHPIDRSDFAPTPLFGKFQVLQILKGLRDQMAYKDILKDAAEPGKTAVNV